MKKIVITAALLLTVTTCNSVFAATTFMTNTMDALKSTKNAVKTDINAQKQKSIENQKAREQAQKEAIEKKKAEIKAKQNAQKEAAKKRKAEKEAAKKNVENNINNMKKDLNTLFGF